MTTSYKEIQFLCHSLTKHRRLILEMAKRDISDRYAGQMLGIFWAVAHPIIMVASYIFLFAVVFRVKAEGVVTIPGDHTLYMLSGLIPWLVVADVLSRSCALISVQASLVKQVVFPVEVLPVKMVLATLPTFLIGSAGILIYAVAVDRFSMAMMLFPVAAIPLYLFLLGCAFLLSAIGVFLRDTREIVQLYTMVGLFLAPIFYFVDWVPEKIRLIIYANPVTFFIETFHDAAYYGELRSWSVWFIAAVIGMAATALGALVFARLKPYFGSYL
jgi:lipopolysaccharide transport system permease protein